MFDRNKDGGIQLLLSHLGGGGVHQNANICKQGEGGCSYQCESSHIYIFLIEHLVYDVLAIITRLYARKQEQAS